MTVLMVVALLYLVLLFVLVIRQGLSSASNRALLVFMVLIGVWVSMVFGLQVELGHGLLYSQTVFAIAAWSLLALAWFVGSISIDNPHSSIRLNRFLLVSAVVWAVLCYSPLFITGTLVDSATGMPSPQYGPVVIVYISALLALAGLITIMILRGIRHENAKRRGQMRVVGVSVLCATALSAATNFIYPWMTGSTQSALAMPVPIIILMSGLSYAIVRHGLLDIRLALMRTLGYTMTMAVLAAIYIGLAYSASFLFFRESADGALSVFNISLALILALIFQPIKRFFDNFTNQLFYRGEYDREGFLREFGRILSYDTDLRLLLRQSGKYLYDNLGAERVFFAISGRGVIGARGVRKTRMPEDDLEQIEVYYRENYEFPEVMTANFVASESVRAILASHQVYMVLPLILQDQMIGQLFVGEHKSHKYGARDVRVLESIANELTIAVQNSLSVEEIRDLNDGLQQRISEATKELRSSNRQLQKLDKAKDEFISMASHQLRTPLTSIKGYLDMVLDGDLGKITATQRTVLSEAYVSSERMVILINDFLNVSRLQTGKFIIDKREVNIVDMVKEQVTMLRVLAKQHDLKLDAQISPDIPMVMADGDKIRQVIINMVDNAIYYSKPSTTIDILLAKDGDDIVFSVKDTGIGVPDSEKSGLFSKFFRASNARKKRPDGTGVGLFLARKVILSHGGDIIFWSKEGKGSIFGFRLPVGVKPKKD